VFPVSALGIVLDFLLLRCIVLWCFVTLPCTHGSVFHVVHAFYAFIAFTGVFFLLWLRSTVVSFMLWLHSTEVFFMLWLQVSIEPFLTQFLIYILFTNSSYRLWRYSYDRQDWALNGMAHFYTAFRCWFRVFWWSDSESEARIDFLILIINCQYRMMCTVSLCRRRKRRQIARNLPLIAVHIVAFVSFF